MGKFTFGELRKYVAKTDAIEIMLTSLDGDVQDNWMCMDMVPDRYNEMEVVGFGSQYCILNDGSSHRGIEFYLDDIGKFKKEE